jgi:glycosidase
MNNAIKNRIFYHIYPLGFCGAPLKNDFASPAGTGLRSLVEHIPHLQKMGINGVYIGPLFESSAHGYDTVDYFWVDRRLGTNGDLKALVRAYHDAGIIVILDAVFNHTGRDFFAFRDLLQKREASPYRDWYEKVDFSKRSPLGYPFSCEGWAGCYDLVKLDGNNPGCREHLLKALEFWIKEFDIDGLRLDAAADLSPDFMDALNICCKKLKPDFWLVGEVVAGNYRNWAREGRLDSVTNYELYKSLWSSLNDGNFFELAWTLKREWGPPGTPGSGMYRGIDLYNFADNHDVNRVASSLKKKEHLAILYGLLFSLPGIPSIYYGSEYGIRGERTPESDGALRPKWDQGWAAGEGEFSGEALAGRIARYINIRNENPCLTEGSYRELFVSHKQYAFLRETPEDCILVAVNSSDEETTITIPPERLVSGKTQWRDLLTGDNTELREQTLVIKPGIRMLHTMS